MIDTAALRALEQAATPGPWEWNYDAIDECAHLYNGKQAIAYCYDEDGANFTAIAAMRNAMPAFLDELDAARARIVELEADKAGAITRLMRTGMGYNEAAAIVAERQAALRGKDGA